MIPSPPPIDFSHSRKSPNGLAVPVQTVSRGWRAGRYPFMLKDGVRLVELTTLDKSARSLAPP